MKNNSSIFAKIIRKLRKWNSLIFCKLVDVRVLEDMIVNMNINAFYEQVDIDENSKFYSSAKVFNLNNNKNEIIIGHNTHIRGELLVYPYGEGIRIGNYCYIGENSIVRSGEKVVIGDNVLIAHNVTIIDTDSHELDWEKRHFGFKYMIEKGHSKNKGVIKTAPIIIEDNVWISYNVCILKGVTIGRGAIVAAGSVVTKDVLPFTMVAGNPAKIVKQL